MPSSQSEFPLTLAEVLFEELETSNRGMDTRDTEIHAAVIYDDKQRYEKYKSRLFPGANIARK